MSKETIETIYGKYSKYEVIRDSGGVFSGTSFYVFKDGKHWKTHSTLSAAVDAAKAAG